MKKYLLLFNVLITTICFCGCSKEDDSNEDDSNNVILPINQTDGALVAFLNAELPEMHHSDDIYRTSKSFFCEDKSGIKSAIKENIVCVINSRQELADIYMGEKELPEIDFDKNTLIIGQQIMPCLGFYVAKKDLLARDDSLILTLYAKNDCYKLDQALQNLYYWELYPKLLQKTLSVNVIVEYTNRLDIQQLIID